MNITWIILLLILFRGNNGCHASDCDCDRKRDCCEKKQENCDCCEKMSDKTECGCSDKQSSPFPVFNGSGMGNTSTCGCDS